MYEDLRSVLRYDHQSMDPRIGPDQARVAAVVTFFSAGADADRCKRLSTRAGNLVSIGHSCLTVLEQGGGIVL